MTGFQLLGVNRDGCHMWDRKCSLFPDHLISLSSRISTIHYNYIVAQQQNWQKSFLFFQQIKYNFIKCSNSDFVAHFFACTIAFDKYILYRIFLAFNAITETQYAKNELICCTGTYDNYAPWLMPLNIHCGDFLFLYIEATLGKDALSTRTKNEIRSSTGLSNYNSTATQLKFSYFSVEIFTMQYLANEL